MIAVNAITLSVTGASAQIALILAAAAFIAILLWLWFTPSRRWREDAKLPIDDAPRAGHRPSARSKSDSANENGRKRHG